MTLRNMFSSQKSQTVLDNLLHSMKMPSLYTKDETNDQIKKTKKFQELSIMEQLNWPLLPISTQNTDNDEEDIVDKFIRVIQAEDLDEVTTPKVVVNTKLRRTDREEIRKKLAMGTDEEFASEKPIRKPSLHSRLQNGMSLQICFMNETASDCESQCSDTESTQDRTDEIDPTIPRKEPKVTDSDFQPADFISHQARLQAEARFALAQAKEMARMQMHIEKQSLKKSPVSQIVRHSFSKIGFPLADTKRRMSRQILTDMNVAQLQVIVNDFHCQIENLNEALVRLLLERDDLHMEQDSMLVDIEDLTKHLGAKQLMTPSTKHPKEKLHKPLSIKTPKAIAAGAKYK